MFAGGMLGSEVGDAAGQLPAASRRRRRHRRQARERGAAGLPRTVFIAVSDKTVYGMHSRSRRAEPDEILFAVPRAGLTAVVHQRVNVRVLELIDDETGTKIELEGNRLPITHSKDVIHVLTESPQS